MVDIEAKVRLLESSLKILEDEAQKLLKDANNDVVHAMNLFLNRKNDISDPKSKKIPYQLSDQEFQTSWKRLKTDQNEINEELLQKELGIDDNDISMFVVFYIAESKNYFETKPSDLKTLFQKFQTTDLSVIRKTLPSKVNELFGNAAALYDFMCWMYSFQRKGSDNIVTAEDAIDYYELLFKRMDWSYGDDLLRFLEEKPKDFCIKKDAWQQLALLMKLTRNGYLSEIYHQNKTWNTIVDSFYDYLKKTGKVSK